MNISPQAPTALSQRLILFMLATFTPLLALPVLLVFLFKSPPPLATVTLLGVSYYKLFFCLLIAAVGLTVSSILFFRTKLPLIATLFISCLFCSIPLLVGIRYDLTVQQAILNISFFANWPYFLQPFFIFVSVLLPGGILIYIILQVQSIFSRERHSYVFIGAAAFLALTLYLSSYELSRAGTPNMFSFIHSPAPASYQMDLPMEQSAESPFEQQAVGTQEPPPLELTPTQEEPFTPSNQGLTEPAESFESAQSPPLTTDNGFFEVEPAAPTFDAETLRLEAKLKGLMQEIDGKITKLTQLKAAIAAQQKTDLSALNTSIELLNQKTDLLLKHFAEKADSFQQGSSGPAIEQKEAAMTTKPFPSSPKKSTMMELFEQLDLLTTKIETIQTDNNGATAPQTEKAQE